MMEILLKEEKEKYFLKLAKEGAKLPRKRLKYLNKINRLKPCRNNCSK